MLPRVSLKTARKFALNTLMSGLVPFVRSSPGMGKTAMMRSIAKENNLFFVDVRLSQEDPVCLNGLANFAEGRTVFLPPKRFPLKGLDQIPEGYKGWLIHFDELPDAPKMLQSVAYKILLEREIGDFKLHPACFLSAAGNLSTDSACANDLSTALRSRMIHIHVESDPRQFLEVASKLKFDPRVQAYLEYQSGNINGFKQYQLNSSDETFNCERTWEFTSKLSKRIQPDVTKPIPAEFTTLFVGTVGSIANEYVQFTQALDGMTKYKDIVANPDNIAIPEKQAVKFLLTNMLTGSVLEKDMTKIVKFMERMPKEFQMIFVRNCNNNYAWAIDNTAFEGMFDEITETVYG